MIPRYTLYEFITRSNFGSRSDLSVIGLRACFLSLWYRLSDWARLRLAAPSPHARSKTGVHWEHSHEGYVVISSSSNLLSAYSVQVSDLAVTHGSSHGELNFVPFPRRRALHAMGTNSKLKVQRSCAKTARTLLVSSLPSHIHGGALRAWRRAALSSPRMFHLDKPSHVFVFKYFHSLLINGDASRISREK
ncbi:hypothetical protein EVG20_g5261 [Dentipellis fragilis]|uniref:Uncharacterized protein n=1 Tax=Dentipellis fragilis TaxID=205917 RepID=A0A4Y9YVR9_9AGAM|nr:hypothetical protein EVG20_g5261 [Dentipellis fragilis]